MKGSVRLELGHWAARLTALWLFASLRATFGELDRLDSRLTAPGAVALPFAIPVEIEAIAGRVSCRAALRARGSAGR